VEGRKKQIFSLYNDGLEGRLFSVLNVAITCHVAEKEIVRVVGKQCWTISPYNDDLDGRL